MDQRSYYQYYEYYPCRPKNAYVYFSMEERVKLRKELGKLSGKKMMKECAKRWRCLDKTKRCRYEAMAQTDSERYRKEKSAHQKDCAGN